MKALKCSINAVGAQGCGCSSSLCHAHLKMGVLFHKQATVRFDLILAVLAKGDVIIAIVMLKFRQNLIDDKVVSSVKPRK